MTLPEMRRRHQSKKRCRLMASHDAAVDILNRILFSSQNRLTLKNILQPDTAMKYLAYFGSSITKPAKLFAVSHLIKLTANVTISLLSKTEIKLRFG